jgi:hypothetical protein
VLTDVVVEKAGPKFSHGNHAFLTVALGGGILSGRFEAEQSECLTTGGAWRPWRSMPTDGQPPLASTGTRFEKIMLCAGPAAAHAEAPDLDIPNKLTRLHLIDGPFRDLGSHEHTYVRLQAALATTWQPVEQIAATIRNARGC